MTLRKQIFTFNGAHFDVFRTLNQNIPFVKSNINLKRAREIEGVGANWGQHSKQ